MTLLPDLDIAVSVSRCVKVWTKSGQIVTGCARFGPAGFALSLDDGGSVIVTQGTWEDGNEWIHASMAWRDHMPTYDDVATLHESVFGRRRTSYQVFAAQSRHINIHEYALHLWGRVDGRMVLPDFGFVGLI